MNASDEIQKSGVSAAVETPERKAFQMVFMYEDEDDVDEGELLASGR